MEKSKSQIKGIGCAAIERLEKQAIEMEMKELARQLKVVHDEFRSDTFKVIVVGRFKTGKSTMLNALLGRPEKGLLGAEADRGPMPVDDLPTTATLTRISYASPPYVRVWDFNGKAKDWAFSQYHREAVLRDNEKENQEFFKNIREFEVGYPAPLCQYAPLLDSPGTDEAPARTAITNEALRQSDAAIVLYRHDSFAGEGERRWVAENILDSGVRVLTVVNLWEKDGQARTLDDRLRSLAWDKLVRDLQGGEEYRGQDFKSKDIYFICAKRAGESKWNKNARLYEESGMALFERRLTDFLIKERYETHVLRFVRAAEQHADKMAEQIAQRRSALTADQQKLQQASQALQPKLQEARARRDKLPKILDRYRRECVRELQLGFEQMIGRLRQELPSLLKTRPLKSLEGVVGTIKAHFTKKAIAAEAADICMDLVKRRIDEWCKNPATKPGAQQILEPILGRMVEEVADEVVAIQSTFRTMHFELTGWSPAVSRDPKPDVMGRIIGIVGGILLQDVGLIAGGAGGWRGLGGTIGGYLVAGLLSGLMGLSLPVALPLVLVGGLLGGMGATRLGLEARIWEHTCQVADEKFREMPGEARPAIEKETVKAFAKVETAVLKDVGSIVEQEEENIRSVLALNQQNLEARKRTLESLDRFESRINESRKQLTNVTLSAKQVKSPENTGS